MLRCDNYHYQESLCLFLNEFLMFMLLYKLLLLFCTKLLILIWKMLLLTLLLVFNLFRCNLTVNIIHIHHSPLCSGHRCNVTSAIADGIAIHIIICLVIVFLTAIISTWYHTSSPLCIPFFFPKNNWHPLSFFSKVWRHLKGRGNCDIFGVQLSGFFSGVLSINWSRVNISGLTLMWGLSARIFLIPSSIAALSGTNCFRGYP